MSLWLEVDEDGRLLRRSDDVVGLFAGIEPPVQDFSRLFEQRADVRAAVGRRAGAVRFGLGHGAGRVVLDADVSEGGLGARMVLGRVELATDNAEIGRLLLSATLRTADATAIQDADGVILWCDNAFATLTGYANEEIIGRAMRLFRSPAVGEVEIATYWRSLFATGIYRGRTQIRRSDGVDLPVWSSVAAVTDEEGRTTHYVSVLRDVGYDREIERLRNVDTAASLAGRLAGSQAHVINNIAGQILALCETALLSDDPASAGQCLDRVMKLGVELGGLGRGMLVLAPGAGKAGPADLGRLARELTEVVAQAQGDQPSVTVAAPSQGPWIEAPPDVLARLGLHLILRTLDVLDRGAAIDISASEDYDDAVLKIRYTPSRFERMALRWLLPDGTVTGPMVNELWAVTRGTGLRVYAEEEREGGVAVCISGPLASIVPQPVPPPRNAEVRPEGRVLLAEDNEGLREMMVIALQPMFAEVVQAVDGEHAIELLVQHDGAFDLAILDLRMPRRNGLEVLAEARSRWPGLKIIVASGAAPEGVVRSAIAAGARAVLPKPFRPSELRALVRSVRDGAEW